MQQAASEKEPVPGAVIAWQTFGDFLGFNPLCHILVTDGCFYGEKGMFRVALQLLVTATYTKVGLIPKASRALPLTILQGRRNFNIITYTYFL
jgi:hypothetical protein